MAANGSNGSQANLDSQVVMSRACVQCHRKKTKCDMVQPSCGLCLRTASECQYPSERRQSSRPSKRPKIADTASDGSVAWFMNVLRGMDASRPPVLLGQQPPGSIAPTVSSDNEAPTRQIPDDGVVVRSTDREGDHQDIGVSEDCPADLVSYDLALNLIETFFTHIQPWLPALHRPTFMAKCVASLQFGPDSLQHQRLEMKLLLNSMFALAARFSTSEELTSIEPLLRGARFVNSARAVYSQLRSLVDPTLLYLQGCILLAFCAYGTELNSQAWILSGVCVRLAYDLGLSDIDDESNQDREHEDSVRVEEMRRAWWLTWELDTFGSMVTRRTFAVDRHSFTVRLPVSDADWFSGRENSSVPLQTSANSVWKSLHGSQNQEPRAWFLAANHLTSLVYKYTIKKRHDTEDDTDDYLTAVNCLKLALPASFRILADPPTSRPEDFADLNWIMGTHLMLMNAYILLQSVPPRGSDPMLHANSPTHRQDDAAHLRTTSLPRLVARWPVECLSAAHPFFVCLFLPLQPELFIPSPTTASTRHLEDMVELIVQHFADKWGLGVGALGKYIASTYYCHSFLMLLKVFSKRCEIQAPVSAHKQQAYDHGLPHISPGNRSLHRAATRMWIHSTTRHTWNLRNPCSSTKTSSFLRRLMAIRTLQASNFLVILHLLT
jgi:hypothetical protein